MWKGPRGHLLCLLLALSLLAASCASGRPLKKVTLSETGEASSSSYQWQQGALRLAVAGVLSPRETMGLYQELLAYLGEKLGRPVELVQRGSYREINDVIKRGDAELAVVCSGAYVLGRREFGMELLVAPQVGGETVYYSYLIVPKDSSIKGYSQLKGKTFAFSDPLSNSGRLVPAYMLARMGERPDTFFSRYIYTYSHDNSIRAVAEGLVDGANVDSLVYDSMIVANPQLGQRTKIVWWSPPYAINPIVVNPGLDASLKTSLRQLLLDMDRDEKGQAVLRKLGIDRFVTNDDTAYDSIREMLAFLEE